jgi:hypothetical protein
MPGYLNPEFAQNGDNRQALCAISKKPVSKPRQQVCSATAQLQYSKIFRLS